MGGSLAVEGDWRAGRVTWLIGNSNALARYLGRQMRSTIRNSLCMHAAIRDSCKVIQVELFRAIFSVVRLVVSFVHLSLNIEEAKKEGGTEKENHPRVGCSDAEEYRAFGEQ